MLQSITEILAYTLSTFNFSLDGVEPLWKKNSREKLFVLDSKRLTTHLTAEETENPHTNSN